MTIHLFLYQVLFSKLKKIRILFYTYLIKSYTHSDQLDNFIDTFILNILLVPINECIKILI